MAEPTEVRRLYNALINSGNIRYSVLPNGAASILCTAKALAWNWGAAWAQIVASVGAADVWLMGIGMETPSDPAADYEAALGTGAGAAEVNVMTVPYFAGIVFVPYPNYVLAGTRLAGNCRSSTGVADTLNVKALIATGA